MKKVKGPALRFALIEGHPPVTPSTQGYVQLKIQGLSWAKILRGMSESGYLKARVS